MPQSVKVAALIEILEEKYFKKNWLKIPRRKASHESFVESAQMDLISASKEMLKFYHVIFLNGDYNYYCEGEPSHGDIGVLTEFIKKIASSIDDITLIDIKLELQTSFQSNLLNPIEFAHQKITHFVRDLNIQYNFDNKDRLFRADKAEGSWEPDESVSALMTSFSFLINLNEFEHFDYRFDNRALTDLLFIERNCRFLTIDNVIKEAISAKANFLLKKLLYRKELAKVYAGSKTLIYSFGVQSDEEISLSEIEVSDNLKDWEQILTTHYGLHDLYKQKQRDRRKEILKSDISEYKIQDFHGLIKIYKDDSKSLEQAKNLYTDFCGRFKHFKTRCDIYSRLCTKAYLFNNNISLECDNPKIKEHDFEELFHRVNNFQNEDGIKNYFPWYKLASRLISEMNSITADLVDPKKYSLFISYFGIYKKILKEIKQSYEWSIEKSFTPIQLPLSECRSNYSFQIEGYDDQYLFFHTSFILPLDYKQVSIEKEDFISDYKTYSTLATVYDKLQHVVATVQDISAHVRNQERRSIEVIAIFSAVALFSVGSIQIFNNQSVGKDPNMYYKFVLTYGHALAIFVILIWIITRDNLKKVHVFHWILLGIFFLSTVWLIFNALHTPWPDILKSKS